MVVAVEFFFPAAMCWKRGNTIAACLIALVGSIILIIGLFVTIADQVNRVCLCCRTVRTLSTTRSYRLVQIPQVISAMLLALIQRAVGVVKADGQVH